MNPRAITKKNYLQVKYKHAKSTASKITIKWIGEENVPSSLMTEDPREHGSLPLRQVHRQQEGASQPRVAASYIW
jgi:hypothetical protein